MIVREDEITRTWSAFVRDSIGDLTNRVVAERIGASDSTVSNWVRGSNFSQPDGKLVIRFARIFGRPLPQALVAAGYGEESEYVETVHIFRDTSDMTDEEIITAMDAMWSEIRRRHGPLRADPHKPAL